MKLWFCARDITENRDFALYLPIAETELNSRFNPHHEYMIIDNDILECGEFANIKEINILLNMWQEKGIDETQLKVLQKVCTYEELIDVIEREDYIIIDFDAETEQWEACIFADDWWKGYLLYTEDYYSCFPCEVPEELVDYVNYEQNWIAAKTEGWAEVTVNDNTYLVHR